MMDCGHGIPMKLRCGACEAELVTTKPTNPKDAAPFDKAPLHLGTPGSTAYTPRALAQGARK